jgi:hypothetical protein
VSHRCLEPDELEGVRALPPDHPRRREVETCPRCRQLLLSYVEFLEDRSAPDTIDREGAAARLREAFEREMGGPAGAPMTQPEAPGGRSEDDARARTPSDVGPRSAGVWRPHRALRFVMAAAAVAVITSLIGVFLSDHVRRPAGREDVLRTAPDSAGHRLRDRPILFQPRSVASGVELRWTSVPGADAYRVVFMGEDLSQLAILDTGPDTLAVLTLGSLPTGLRGGHTVAWQVEAMQGGYPMTSSETSLVRLP